jgi:small-conductance mechanosensitive channel
VTVACSRVVALVAALWLIPLPAASEDAAPPKEAAPAAVATPEPSNLTLDEIGGRAEAVAARLRAMTTAIADEAAFSKLENDVFQQSHRVSDRWKATDQILSLTLRRNPLETLASSWRALRTQLEAVQKQVDARATARAADLTTLDQLEKLWIWTLDHAKSQSAPAPVIERVEATLAAIGATRAEVDARNSRLLVLQDAVSRAIQACDDAGERIEDAREKSVDRIFAANAAPVWHLFGAQTANASRPEPAAPTTSDVAAVAEGLRIYAYTYRRGFAVTLAIAALMVWSFYRMRRAEARAPVSSHAALPEFVTQVLQRPIATAILLTIFVTAPLRPDQPAGVKLLLYLIGLPASLILLRPALDPRLVRPFFLIASFFLVDVARGVLQPGVEVEQLVLILEMTLATGLLFWIAALMPNAIGTLVATSPWSRRTGRWVAHAAGIATAVSAVAASLGYIELADFVGGGALMVIYLSIGVLALRVAASGAVWLALVRSPLARLYAIRDNYTKLGHAITQAIGYATVALWSVVVLQRFELFRPALGAIDAVLDAQLKAGELTVSLGHVFSFVAVIFGAWVTTRVVVFMLDEDVYPRMKLARGIPYALSTMVRYGLLLAGFFAALATLGLDLTRLTVLVSAFGLALGFGMQQIINNFVSGLILLFERPVQVGDLVQLTDLSGEVKRIGIRASVVRTLDGAEVVIPNSDLIQNQVTNWTLSDRRRRVTLEIGITYGTEATRVLGILVEIAKRDPRVSTDPAPEALFTGFGASSLDFQLRFWTEDPLWMRVKSDIGVALQQALREAEIGVPFTTITVQVEPPAAHKTDPSAS